MVENRVPSNKRAKSIFLADENKEKNLAAATVHNFPPLEIKYLVAILESKEKAPDDLLLIILNQLTQLPDIFHERLFKKLASQVTDVVFDMIRNSCEECDMCITGFVFGALCDRSSDQFYLDEEFIQLFYSTPNVQHLNIFNVNWNGHQKLMISLAGAVEIVWKHWIHLFFFKETELEPATNTEFRVMSAEQPLCAVRLKSLTLESYHKNLSAETESQLNIFVQLILQGVSNNSADLKVLKFLFPRRTATNTYWRNENQAYLTDIVNRVEKLHLWNMELAEEIFTIDTVLFVAKLQELALRDVQACRSNV
uniref:Uncharacterized protein n=1 Tax=Ditylenchus dipsaci TaxID=166011 RepID=A0A915DXX2_9BILA